ncbi:hypothetical protein Tco_1273833 [Tanacetum coccineum]
MAPHLELNKERCGVLEELDVLTKKTSAQPEEVVGIEKLIAEDLLVILLILTTVTLFSMNSPTDSQSEVGYKGPMMLMDGDLNNPRSMSKDEEDSSRTETEKELHIEGLFRGQNDVTEESEIVKPTIEDDDSTNNGPSENETERIKDTDTLLSKLANVDPKFAAFNENRQTLKCQADILLPMEALQLRR